MIIKNISVNQIDLLKEHAKFFGKEDEELCKSHIKTHLIKKCVIIMSTLYGIYVLFNLNAYIWTFFPKDISDSTNEGVCYIIFNIRVLDMIIWEYLEFFFDFFI